VAYSNKRKYDLSKYSLSKKNISTIGGWKMEKRYKNLELELHVINAILLKTKNSY